MPVEPVSHPDNEIPPSYGDLFRQLIDDVAAYLHAERQVYGVQSRLARRAAGWVALYALGAIVIAQGAMIALVVGMLLTLVPVMGPAWATALILFACIVTAALFIWLIRGKLRSVKNAWRRRHDG
jgi:Putative Actinobacterial Holin-X, holin superfamily III